MKTVSTFYHWRWLYVLCNTIIQQNWRGNRHVSLCGQDNRSLLLSDRRFCNNTQYYIEVRQVFYCPKVLWLPDNSTVFAFSSIYSQLHHTLGHGFLQMKNTVPYSLFTQRLNDWKILNDHVNMPEASVSVMKWPLDVTLNTVCNKNWFQIYRLFST